MPQVGERCGRECNGCIALLQQFPTRGHCTPYGDLCTPKCRTRWKCIAQDLRVAARARARRPWKPFCTGSRLECEFLRLLHVGLWSTLRCSDASMTIGDGAQPCPGLEVRRVQIESADRDCCAGWRRELGQAQLFEYSTGRVAVADGASIDTCAAQFGRVQYTFSVQAGGVYNLSFADGVRWPRVMRFFLTSTSSSEMVWLGLNLTDPFTINVWVNGTLRTDLTVSSDNYFTHTLNLVGTPYWGNSAVYVQTLAFIDVTLKTKFPQSTDVNIYFIMDFLNNISTLTGRSRGSMSMTRVTRMFKSTGEYGRLDIYVRFYEDQWTPAFNYGEDGLNVTAENPYSETVALVSAIQLLEQLTESGAPFGVNVSIEVLSWPYYENDLAEPPHKCEPLTGPDGFTNYTCVCDAGYFDTLCTSACACGTDPSGRAYACYDGISGDGSCSCDDAAYEYPDCTSCLDPYVDLGSGCQLPLTTTSTTAAAPTIQGASSGNLFPSVMNFTTDVGDLGFSLPEINWSVANHPGTVAAVCGVTYLAAFGLLVLVHRKRRKLETAAVTAAAAARRARARQAMRDRAAAGGAAVEAPPVADDAASAAPAATPAPAGQLPVERAPSGEDYSERLLGPRDDGPML
eukprot:NODE_970_length_2668_cov_3.561590.p1 GENE.NODE_970_length_2668_cov_3.561590~~NODE_970_length_2668_cov_3.561590.p1  ORF type:complete len:628 (-),score=59.06 NODE_970_length_2668_cov_3.561590:241-2124(-)